MGCFLSGMPLILSVSTECDQAKEKRNTVGWTYVLRTAPPAVLIYSGLTRS
jgi:hypothetical protein